MEWRNRYPTGGQRRRQPQWAITDKKKMMPLSQVLPLIHLLLVEDSPLDARLLLDYLRRMTKANFQTVVVDTLENALTYLDTNPVDLIILDLVLPDSQGSETLIRLLERQSTIPVIVLSGLNDEELAVEAVRLGAQDYLVKSQVNSDLIFKSIAYAIKRGQVMEALRESEERYALAAQAANDGLWDWNLRTDSLYFSPRWCGMLGAKPGEIPGTPSEWFSRVHSDDLSGLQTAIQRHLQSQTEHVEVEYRLRHQNGTYRWMQCRGVALFDQNGKAYRLAGSQTDITLRKHTEQRLLHEALHDSLTKLPNRILFRRRLQEVFECFKAHLGPGFAVLFMDMDRFKTINDSLGHLVGDQLLCAITRRLENCLPPGRTIARLGGDEFAILLESLSVPGDALRVAKRILDALEHPFQVQQHTIFATGCIGIALSNSQYVNPEEILRDADTAMYRAKAVGLGQYQVFDAAMHTRAMEIWRLETDLRRAVERHEFSIHYQPIVSLASGRLAGFEALVRWNHPERGLLFPGEFLAVADETGLLTTIDRWMILNGAKQIKKWQEKFPNSANLFLSLNLSDGLINQPDLPDFIGLVLQETKVDPRTIKLEITERVIAYEWSSLHQTLARLRGMNIQLSLDDFGTGYSSLSSLHSYPVDVLKIASNFVSAMTNDNSALEIVRTIITLAHDLHLQVIAEGVETECQYAQLAEMGCEFGQGRLFTYESPPTILTENITDLPVVPLSVVSTWTK